MVGDVDDWIAESRWFLGARWGVGLGRLPVQSPGGGPGNWHSKRRSANWRASLFAAARASTGCGDIGGEKNLVEGELTASGRSVHKPDRAGVDRGEVEERSQIVWKIKELSPPSRPPMARPWS